MRDKIYQEAKCQQAKASIDYLRTALFEIEDFDEFEKYERILKKLKSKIDKIYWEL